MSNKYSSLLSNLATYFPFDNFNAGYKEGLPFNISTTITSDDCLFERLITFTSLSLLTMETRCGPLPILLALLYSFSKIKCSIIDAMVANWVMFEHS